MTQSNPQPANLLDANGVPSNDISASNNVTEQRLDALFEQVNQVWRMDKGLFRSLRPLHWIGYGLLVLFSFDLAIILYPPRFMNPSWEFQVIGQMVERAPVPLLGFALIFIGEKALRPTWERPFVRILSWLTLIISVIFFLMVPLGITDTVRLIRLGQAQVQEQVDGLTEQLEAVNQQFDRVTTPAEMQVLIDSLDQDTDVEISNAQAMETAREKVTVSLENGVRQVQTKAQVSLRNQRKQVIRNSVKWNLGALIIASLFLTLWKGTRWARVRW